MEGYVNYIEENFEKDIQEMSQYFPVICGEWCLFNSLAVGRDTKGGQTVLNGQEGVSEESLTPEQKRENLSGSCKSAVKGLGRRKRLFLLEL
mgnify:CR=1 FL=1